jgi:hypothetical protein
VRTEQENEKRKWKEREVSNIRDSNGSKEEEMKYNKKSCGRKEAC